MARRWLQLCRGSSRIVLLVGQYAVKLPRVSSLYRVAQGVRCNRAEVEAWTQRIYPNLCPLLWSSPGSLVVVMPRARIMSDSEFDAWFESDEWPHFVDQDTPCELKSADAGFLPDGRRVMVDYGVEGYR